MTQYIIKRILLFIPVMLGVTVLIFILMYSLPGTRVNVIVKYETAAQRIDGFCEALGIKDTVFHQLIKYCYNVYFRLDFGNSRASGRSVIKEIGHRLPKTLLLFSLSTALAWIIGLPLGIIAAVNKNTWKDTAVMTASVLGVSMPTFWAGILMAKLFAWRLRLLPATGYYGPKYLILPVICLAFGGLATIARMTRSSMLEIIDMDYVMAARSKGLRERIVIYRHALRNAVIPLITILGNQLGAMVGGSMVIEFVFAIPGIGTYLFDAITTRDTAITMCGVLMLAACAGVMNLLSDIAYAFANPKIKSQYIVGKREKPGTKAGLRHRAKG